MSLIIDRWMTELVQHKRHETWWSSVFSVFGNVEIVSLVKYSLCLFIYSIVTSLLQSKEGDKLILYNILHVSPTKYCIRNTYKQYYTTICAANGPYFRIGHLSQCMTAISVPFPPLFTIFRV